MVLLPKYRSGKTKVLDWDLENRPLSYLGKDFTTAEVTAIACKFVGERKIRCWLLGSGISMKDMLGEFREVFSYADVVTGHYILGHDLPIVSGALIEQGLDPLPPKLASDTYFHLKKFKGISKSQENLAAMLGLSAPKVQMNTIKWREANRLTPDGLALTEARVVGDVLQHTRLRAKLIELDLLKPPKMWRP